MFCVAFLDDLNSFLTADIVACIHKEEKNNEQLLQKKKVTLITIFMFATMYFHTSAFSISALSALGTVFVCKVYPFNAKSH